MMDVKFLRGLSTKFATITPDSKTFYFLTDTNELYLGSVLLSNEITAVEFEALEDRVGKLEVRVADHEKRLDTIEAWKELLPEYVTTEAFQNWLTTVFEPHVAAYEADLVAQDKRDDEQEKRITALETSVKDIEENYVTLEDYNSHVDAQEVVDGKQDKRIAALESTVDGIVSVGGEANIIEAITVDGEEVKIEGKTAKITLNLENNLNTLLNTINEEINARSVGDDVLRGEIAAEAKDRAAADEDLQKAIVAEAEIREAADEDLQKQIDAIETALETVDTNTTYTLSYDSDSQEIVLTPSEGQATRVDAKDFIIDGMLESVVADQTANTLTFTWNTASGKTETTVIELSSIADIYTGSTNADEVNVTVSNENVISATIGANVAAKIGHGEDAYNWGNHAQAGYLKEHQSLEGYATEAYVMTAVKTEENRAKGAEADLQEQIDALEKKHTDQVVDLQEQIDALETKHIQEVADLDARLDKVEPAIPAMEEDIAKLEERVAELETGLEDEAKARAEADAALAEQIDVLDKRVDVIEEQLDGFDTKKGAVKDYVDAADAVLAEQIETNAGICEQNFTAIVNQLTWGEF